ncbi:MAG: ATP synthase F1 subunit delta [Eubacteriales bacterium]|nr:ATP synthase F1 subunit delta [Eubacteriales bacterium]
MAKLISSIYGDALFELAQEENSMDALYDEVEAARNVFVSNEDLSRLLNHPEIVKEEKIAVVENIFRGRVSEHVLGFLHIIVEKDRYNEIPAIFAHFLRRVKQYRGVGTVSVTSAVPLSSEQQASVEKRLREITDYKSFEVEYTVDPSILGGLIIRIEDRVVDSSLKTQMDDLTRQLSKIHSGASGHI